MRFVQSNNFTWLALRRRPILVRPNAFHSSVKWCRVRTVAGSNLSPGSIAQRLTWCPLRPGRKISVDSMKQSQTKMIFEKVFNWNYFSHCARCTLWRCSTRDRQSGFTRVFLSKPVIAIKLSSFRSNCCSSLT